LADELSGRANLQNVTHTDTTMARKLLVRNSDEEASFHYENSPHFQMIISPFLKHLKHVAESPGQGRPSLPGDEYLREFDLSNGSNGEITLESTEGKDDYSTEEEKTSDGNDVKEDNPANESEEDMSDDNEEKD
jgi:hypothetical protein